MKEISDIDEVNIFVENLVNIIRELKLNKTALNKKLNWPVNKLTGILKKTQAPLIKDAKDVRELLGVTSTDLLTRILNTDEIHAFAPKLNGLELHRKTRNQNNFNDDNATNSPVACIIIVLHYKYSVNEEFTKKQIIELLPSEFASYNIEWPKSRLRNYIEKVRKVINAENKQEHIFHLKRELPTELVQKAMLEVSAEWLEEFEIKFKHKNTDN